ncbi:signal peptide peptidase SppA [Wenyingzhuangia aestuarii]|uniref:signal peptide peptidase SppA n=1 Tax=Wenyingzhuangia aestuarii TaxID=1647582 RepID=UPI001438801A|nr:signal peptide peptidase SppA [Wenyingzhuangia aestuarii]NJB82422.1 protease-4 [Wenyingzhuangia aestuarii]
MNFIKNVLSSLVAIWLAIAIFVVIGIGVVIAVSDDIVKEVKPNTVLEIDLSGQMDDFAPVGIDPVSEVLGFEEKTVGFNNVCKAIEGATYDDNIKGISLKNLPSNMGWAQATALRKMLTTFKNNGKFVYAFADVYTQKNYYLSSIADSLFVSPLGYVELKGLHSEVMFYKSFQEKYGVKMEVIRHGKYKSAVEPFIADEMSDSNRKQISELIEGLWTEIHKSIFTSRSINVEEAVMNLYGESSKTALENNLVDGVVYQDAYQNKLKKRLGQKEFKKVAITDYMTNQSLSSLAVKGDKIAVVYAQGEIVYGEGELNVIGQKKMIKALTNAVENKNVKAIVFRINSPGGSALASDLIWRAVEKAKEKKPVIVSMGNVAASGGYYIACGADRVFAEPTTITGSIGVFGMLPNAAKLAQKIGINSEVVSTHNNGANYSVVQPIDDRFKAVVKKGIETIYDNFLERVAKGRNMTKAQVDAIAQGRVWTGKKALEIGLVDELGGLDNAVAYAATKAGVENYSLKEYPEYELDFSELLSVGSFLKSETNIDEILTNTGLDKIVNVKKILEMKGTQARIPFELDIK